MISQRIDNSDEAKLDLAMADPEGLVRQMLVAADRRRRTRRVWICFASFSLLICGVAFAAIMLSAPTTAFASDKTSEGWKLWQARKLAEAETIFREALAENEKDSNAWNGLGWCLSNTGRHTEAIAAFKKCLEVDANHTAALNGVGQSSLAIGDLKTAEEFLLKGAEEFEKSLPESQRNAQNIPAAWFGLTNLYLLKEDYANAQQSAEKILKYSPQNSDVQSLLDQAKRKDNSQLKKQFEALAKVTSSGKTQKAWMLWQQRKFAEAELLFREALKEDEKDQNSWNGLGWCLQNSGKPAEAIEAFQKCLAIDPNHDAAMNGVGQSSLRTKDWKTAEEYFKKGCDRYLASTTKEQRNAENLPAAAIGLVTVSLLTENYDQATEWAERIVEQLPEESDLKSSVSQMLEQAKAKNNTEVKKRFDAK